MEELFLKLMQVLASVEGASLTVAIVLEFVFRLVPSQKPLSIAHLVAGFARKSSEALKKLADVMDKILPQVKKEE
jgi:hypothetical protein